MGRLIANLILNYSSLLGFEYNPKRKGYQIYILKFIKRVYNIFKFKLIRLFKMEVNSSSVKIEKYFNEYLYQMLSFISLTIISRLYDEGLCLDLKRIKKLKQRAIAQEFAVRISKKILYNNKTIGNIDDLIILIEKENYKFQYNKIKKWVVKAAQ